MSHGCDSADYEAILGPMPGNGQTPPVEQPVLFLLENPGKDNDNVFKFVRFGEYKKKPPAKHYYFAPTVTFWPRKLDGLDTLYGSYFAYLMGKHQLRNVYITNLVKRKYHPSERKTTMTNPLGDLGWESKTELLDGLIKTDIQNKCVELYLSREIE